MAERQQQCLYPVLWTLDRLTLYNWSVSLGEKCPEGLKKPKNGSEEHSCASSACLASITQRHGRRHSLLCQVEQEPACCELPLSYMNL